MSNIYRKNGCNIEIWRRKATKAYVLTVYSLDLFSFSCILEETDERFEKVLVKIISECLRRYTVVELKNRIELAKVHQRIDTYDLLGIFLEEGQEY